MTDEMAEELLDDLSSDGKQIFSNKITFLGTKRFILSKKYGTSLLLKQLNLKRFQNNRNFRQPTFKIPLILITTLPRVHPASQKVSRPEYNLGNCN